MAIRELARLLGSVEPGRFLPDGPRTKLDAALAAELDRLRDDGLTAGSLELAPRLQTALGRFAARCWRFAAREADAHWLEVGLFASALAARDDDERDVMVGLAIPHVLARRLLGDAAPAFARAADAAAGEHAELLRGFGARQDVTLAAFGWREVAGSAGAEFRAT